MSSFESQPQLTNKKFSQSFAEVPAGLLKGA